MTDEQIEKLEEQAYAQIIWGEDRKEVLQSLLGKGVPREEAERIVRDSLKDRAAEIRKEGIRNIIWGTVLVGISVVAIAAYYHFSAVIYFKLVGVLMVPGVYGLFRLSKGIPRLVLGKESGSISGMD